jgi:hypothetical protein
MLTRFTQAIMWCLTAPFLFLSQAAIEAPAATSDWIMKDLTVGEYFDGCPANFGSKPIKEGSEDFSNGLWCFSVYRSLQGYLDGTKQTCPGPASVSEAEFTNMYRQSLKQVFRAKKNDPKVKYQDVVSPALKKRYPCV